jgi:pSer/pThr/pTyr-binding forkhead associated (FHA) protein
LIIRLALAVLLYAFLATALWIVRRDLQTAAREAIGRERSHGRLIVLAAESPALPVGISFPVLAVTTLGRSPSNSVPLDDGYASAEHALLSYRAGQWWLEDQGSRNGTQLNGVLVNVPVVVSSGDVIGIGRVQLKLELA